MPTCAASMSGRLEASGRRPEVQSNNVEPIERQAGRQRQQNTATARLPHRCQPLPLRNLLLFSLNCCAAAAAVHALYRLTQLLYRLHQVWPLKGDGLQAGVGLELKHLQVMRGAGKEWAQAGRQAGRQAGKKTTCRECIEGCSRRITQPSTEQQAP